MLPPGQQLAARDKWPIVGERMPAEGPVEWSLTVGGLVDRPRTFTLQELTALPQATLTVDIHCVTRWSKPGAEFGGVLLKDLLSVVRPLPEARFVSFMARSERRHDTSLPLDDALRLGVLLATLYAGGPLPVEHGGPLRVVTPRRYFYKSLKWASAIELLAEDRLGYWEREAGYHNEADPWREQRYLAPSLDRREVQTLLATRDFSGRDLRSLSAAGLELRGLLARDALLRDADFRGACLAGACFDGANLSNAHFERAELSGAAFRGADLEGANFSGADLRGADLSGAALTAATFCPERDGQLDEAAGVIFDAATHIDAASLESLTPWQAQYVRQRLGR
jgi:DMSO/TMAO reductase YedYZ molybdopterin-dependent catalytic subunit